MTKRYLGNIITPNPTAPSGPYEDDTASRVWSLAEAFAYTKAGLWPTAGNAVDFGDLSSADAVPPSCVADPTRMVARHSGTTTMDYFTIATTGNATDFGDATEQAINSGACSNAHGGLAA